MPQAYVLSLVLSTTVAILYPFTAYFPCTCIDRLSSSHACCENIFYDAQTIFIVTLPVLCIDMQVFFHVDPRAFTRVPLRSSSTFNICHLPFNFLSTVSLLAIVIPGLRLFCVPNQNFVLTIFSFQSKRLTTIYPLTPNGSPFDE